MTWMSFAGYVDLFRSEAKSGWTHSAWERSVYVRLAVAKRQKIEVLGEEMSGFDPKDQIEKLYTYATTDAYSFLCIRLDAKTRRDAFWLRFEARLVPETSDEDKDGHGSLDQSAGRHMEERRPGRAQVRQKGSDLPDSSTTDQALRSNPVRKGVRPRKQAL